MSRRGVAGLLRGWHAAGQPSPVRRVGRRRAGEGQGQGGDPDLAVGRAVATSTRSIPSPTPGPIIAGPLKNPIDTNVDGDPDQRAVAAVGQAGRQVLADPQHDPRQQRPRDGGLHGADRAAAGRARRLSVRRRGGVALQGLRGRLQGADSALHRAHATAGAVLRGRLPGPRATSRSPPAAIPAQTPVRRRRGRRPGHHRTAAAGSPRVAAQARRPGARAASTIRS